MPCRAHNTDSGIDFFIPNCFEEWELAAGEIILIDLGVKIILPKWYDLQLIDKSWVSSKTGLSVLGGLIDNWYRGELKVCLVNTSNKVATLSPWMKIVQGVVRAVNYCEIEEVDLFTEEQTQRGEGGFGSTGLFDKKSWET